MAARVPGRDRCCAWSRATGCARATSRRSGTTARRRCGAAGTRCSPGDRRRPEDYPVTTAGDGPSDIVMWNGVGGSTVHWEGHFPRFHPSDFAVRRLDGVADDWPIAYTDLEPFYDINDAMIGVSGLAGDPANAPRAPAHHAAAAARPIRRSAGSRLREARLALVAVRQRDHLARLRRPHRLRQPRHAATSAAR